MRFYVDGNEIDVGSPDMYFPLSTASNIKETLTEYIDETLAESE